MAEVLAQNRGSLVAPLLPRGGLPVACDPKDLGLTAPLDLGHTASAPPRLFAFPVK